VLELEEAQDLIAFRRDTSITGLGRMVHENCELAPEFAISPPRIIIQYWQHNSGYTLDI
jgi:hypothetical protein